MKSVAKMLALVAALGVATAMADDGGAKEEEPKGAPAPTNAPAQQAQSQSGASN